jgi:hypothetical protein
MSLRESILDTIKTNRPQLSQSSANTYASLLVNLAKKMDLKEFNQSNKKDILDYIDKNITSLQSKKTILSALYILTGNTDYREVMLQICKEVNDNYKQQKVAPNRENSFISFDKVKEIYENLKTMYKQNPTLEHLENIIIVGLMSGSVEGIVPRRNEWAMVKIKDYDKEKDNYLEKGICYFHKFKTDKIYGSQSVKIKGTEIMKYITKWLKTNPTEYLLYNLNTNKPFSSSDLSKRLKKIFNNENIGCDQLRSIYLSHLYKNVPKLSELQNTAEAMGHSLNTAFTNYVKKD